MKISVVGLGKIGLPLAAHYSSMGNFVFGCDVNTSVVQTVNSGHATFSGEPGLEERIQAATSQGSLVASTETSECVRSSDVVVVVVPLLVDGHGTPIFDLIDSATRAVGAGLSSGTLVCFETTLPVGTTRNRLTKILERESGLDAGVDFYVAFSPERVYTGKVFENLKQYPKLVGGINPASTQAAIDFYRKVLTFEERSDLAQPNGVWNLGSVEAAEFAKLAETTYRDVNIALANQFALYSDRVGIDVYKVIEACNSQPFSHIHQPGIAVGGHCIPVYPHMYLTGDPGATVVSAAREANKSMPRKAIEGLERLIGNLSGKKIAILGLSYRGGVKEHAFSGTWDLVSELKLRGAIPAVHDPLYSKDEIEELGLECYQFDKFMDCGIVQSDHDFYRNLGKSQMSLLNLILDGRNILNPNLGDDPSLIVLGKGQFFDAS